MTALLSLLANSSPDVADASFLGFPSYFGVMLLAVIVVAGLGLALLAIAWRVLDWITPGDLNLELVPDPVKTPSKRPNVALAVVIGCMFIAVAIVLGATIHGVLTH